jgi:hypothetical protein
MILIVTIRLLELQNIYANGDTAQLTDDAPNDTRRSHKVIQQGINEASNFKAT